MDTGEFEGDDGRMDVDEDSSDGGDSERCERTEKKGRGVGSVKAVGNEEAVGNEAGSHAVGKRKIDAEGPATESPTPER